MACGRRVDSPFVKGDDEVARATSLRHHESNCRRAKAAGGVQCGRCFAYVNGDMKGHLQKNCPARSLGQEGAGASRRRPAKRRKNLARDNGDGPPAAASARDHVATSRTHARDKDGDGHGCGRRISQKKAKTQRSRQNTVEVAPDALTAKGSRGSMVAVRVLFPDSVTTLHLLPDQIAHEPLGSIVSDLLWSRFALRLDLNTMTTWYSNVAGGPRGGSVSRSMSVSGSTATISLVGGADAVQVPRLALAPPAGLTYQEMRDVMEVAMPQVEINLSVGLVLRC